MGAWECISILGSVVSRVAVPASELSHAPPSPPPALSPHHTAYTAHPPSARSTLTLNYRSLSPMATPSSSGTSPSPALSFALPTSASENSTDEPNDQDQQEREERRKKLIARTELAKVSTRSSCSPVNFPGVHYVRRSGNERRVAPSTRHSRSMLAQSAYT